VITAKQAVKACILAEFLTSKSFPIRVFQYLEAENLIRVEAGFRTRQIRIVINEEGKFKYV
jgi:hypothetical protein